MMISTKLDRILVPTDFSDTGAHAIRYASELARRLRAHLTLVYSDSFVPPIDYTATVGGWDESTFEELKARSEEQLRHDAQLNIDPAVAYDTVVHVGATIDGILAQARESGAGLIVMGTHGRTGFRRLVMGSVTEAVMRSAQVPVIAVPPCSATTPSIKVIVCPVNYKAQCLAALTFAARIAPPDARFIVIRSTQADDVVESAQDLFELRAWVPDAIEARCEFRMFGNEHVPEQIESFAKSVRADLIVTGEAANRTAADVLHGTLAARLVWRSECPVLTVNGPAALVGSRVARQEERTRVVWMNQ